MANLKEIRDRIKSINSIQQVTSAMKMVAAAKLRTSQNNMEKCRPYSKEVLELINNLMSDCNASKFSLMEERKIKKTLYVVITSDRGMAGAFNTNIIKKAQKDIDKSGKEHSIIMCIGKKSRDYFKSRNFNVTSEHTDFWNNLNFDYSIAFGKEIIDLFLSKEIDNVKVYYNEFKNLATQIIQKVDFLPLKYNSNDVVKKMMTNYMSHQKVRY